MKMRDICTLLLLQADLDLPSTTKYYLLTFIKWCGSAQLQSTRARSPKKQL